MTTLGRPHALDDAKRQQVCQMIAAGCGIAAAAKMVGCSPATLRREAQRNDDFHNQLRDAERSCQMDPLNAIKQASATHWRAAAWLLERTRPERFAKRDPKLMTAEDVDTLVEDIFQVFSSEISDQATIDRINDRLNALRTTLRENESAENTPPSDPKRFHQPDPSEEADEEYSQSSPDPITDE